MEASDAEDMKEKFEWLDSAFYNGRGDTITLKEAYVVSDKFKKFVGFLNNPNIPSFFYCDVTFEECNFDNMPKDVILLVRQFIDKTVVIINDKSPHSCGKRTARTAIRYLKRKKDYSSDGANLCSVIFDNCSISGYHAKLLFSNLKANHISLIHCEFDFVWNMLKVLEDGRISCLEDLETGTWSFEQVKQVYKLLCQCCIGCLYVNCTHPQKRSVTRDGGINFGPTAEYLLSSVGVREPVTEAYVEVISDKSKKETKKAEKKVEKNKAKSEAKSSTRNKVKGKEKEISSLPSKGAHRSNIKYNQT